MTMLKSINDIISGQGELLEEPIMVDSDGNKVEDTSPYLNIKVTNLVVNNTYDRLEVFERTRESMSNILEVMESLDGEKNRREYELLKNSLLSLSETIDIASEEIATESADGTITMEGIWGFVKNVWVSFIDLVKNFFKALYDFVRSLLKGTKSSKSVDTEVSKGLDSIAKSEVTIDESKVIHTNLPFLLNMDDINSPSYESIYHAIRRMDNRYKSLIENDLKTIIDNLNTDVIQNTIDFSKGIDSEVSIGSVNELVHGYGDILVSTSSLVKSVLTNPVPAGSLPPEVAEKISSKKRSSNHKVMSLLPVDDPDGAICRKYNIFGIVADNTTSAQDLLNMNDSQLTNAFVPYVDNNDKNISSTVRGISHSEDAEKIKEFEKHIVDVDFKGTEGKLKDIERKILSAIDQVKNTSRPKVMHISKTITAGVDIKQFLEDVRYDVDRYDEWPAHLASHSFSFIAGLAKGDKYSDIGVPKWFRDKYAHKFEGFNTKFTNRELHTMVDDMGKINEDKLAAMLLRFTDEVPSAVIPSVTKAQVVRESLDEDTLEYLKSIDNNFDKSLLGVFRLVLNIIRTTSLDIPKGYAEYVEARDTFRRELSKL